MKNSLIYVEKTIGLILCRQYELFGVSDCSSSILSKKKKNNTVSQKSCGSYNYTVLSIMPTDA